MTEYLGDVADLFSGGGGMSYGFCAHPAFDIIGAADAEIGKPSTGHGAIGCNSTYEANMKVRPLAVDLSKVDASVVASGWFEGRSSDLKVLLACPPCTGFSRAVHTNYVADDPRNGLVARVAEFVEALNPQLLFMENVPQLINGNFRSHYLTLRGRLEELGYKVHADVHRLDRFGLPQIRERALIIAAKKDLPLYTMDDLWGDWRAEPAATTVRRAIGALPHVVSGETHPDDSAHTSTLLAGESLERLQAIPRDGGSWPDLFRDKSKQKFLIPSMWTAVERGRLNSYRDVYGRMSWDRPAPTIKRECSHIGNGRYAHPEQDRQCTVRELAVLQGFPRTYKFTGGSRKNLYRQVGDAVPPIVSYQLASLAAWMLSGNRPEMEQIVLPETSLRVEDLVRRGAQMAIDSC
ncbi:DNA cytosine methyltransferase [Parafrankia sp. Ea1.12]|uniref:DNA cytosine methyltransferase n=1 Tax=Parafrankia sp. Ea1.12 TaxID=573499 RepID=UPI00190F6B2D|nr:DNA cytosine methyltransferase [Parafrankia sp. Ea1.12]